MWQRKSSSVVTTVVQCYSMFSKFFPQCGLLDYTEGLYDNDPTLPFDEAQKRQIRYVLDEVKCAAGTRILEVGCGNGTLLEEIRARGAQGIGITISPEQVAFCRGKGLDARLLNYRDIGREWNGQFDAVVANGPIEHFVQPRDAVEHKADSIYRQMFDICRGVIDPRSPLKRFINTTIHFIRVPDPRDLLKDPRTFPKNSDSFHWAMLARSFGGWYPELGQLERAAAGFFKLVKTVDGTYDYHLTSEEWLRRLRRVLPTAKGAAILVKALPFAIRHPRQYFTMLSCMLGSESWNWQFRAPDPPTRLLRQTWDYA